MSKISSNPQSFYDIDDFTISKYTALLEVAKLNYSFVLYEEVELADNFILWRHDCDISLNRALHLAKIDRNANIRSTFFLNPHCEFYNLLEKSQSQIVEEIITLGHDIGLHFDAAFYDISSEGQLDLLVEREAEWLKNWFGIEIKVFSFHNPTEFLLTCEQSQYGNLINCYSSFFKKNVPYCSDSNGYWRFRRLHDVLEQASDKCLQVLTHPCWWQEEPMPPRARVVRAIEGRASFLICGYDQFLEVNGRKNVR